MARTRTQIKTWVDYYTGRGTEKATLIELLCDEALQIAIEEHPFEDSLVYSGPASSDVAITEDATSVDVSAWSGIQDIITATVVEASGTLNKPLMLKDETWWNKNVINAEDNQKGWPDFGIRRDTTVYINRPADSGLELRAVYSASQTFAADATVCPIAILDIFVTQYVTAMLFLSIQNNESYKYWYNLCMGFQYVMTGKVGGTLGRAIEKDKRDRATVTRVERGPVLNAGVAGVGVQNLISGHDDYGNTRLWSQS